jgi:DNA replication and repair protein RecF
MVWFRRLELSHFRNLSAVTVDLCPRFNFLHGENGAGKTAFLEAVHMLARGRSFRTTRVEDVIETGFERLVIRAAVEDEHRGAQQFAMARSQDGGTELRINGESSRRLSDVAAILPLELMIPAVTELVFGPPAERRRWLDWGMFHVEPGYAGVLRQYLGALRQRNAALRAIGRGELRETDLGIWTSEVVRLALEVDRTRREFMATLLPRIEAELDRLSPGFRVSARYSRGWADAADLEKLLGQSVRREVKSGVTSHGPHRADVDLRVDGKPCATTLSRGQGKVLASALMLARATQVADTARRASVFLIDDIGAELDATHRDRLFAALWRLGCQVIATSVEPPGPGPAGADLGRAVFHVKHGRLTPDVTG